MRRAHRDGTRDAVGRTSWAIRPTRLLAGFAVVVSFLSLVASPAPAHTPHDDISDVALSPAYAEDETVFAISANRLLRSTDGGASWNEVVRGLPRAPEEGKSLFRIAIAPSDPRVVYVTSRVGGVFRSEDSGSSFVAATGLEADDVAAISVSPVDPELLLAAGTFGGLFRSDDGGRSWTQVVRDIRVPAVTFQADGLGAVYGDVRGRIWRSVDGGAGWTEVTSTDGGSSVSMVSADGDASGAGRVWVGTDAGDLLRSDDGGATFSSSDEGLPAEGVVGFTVSPVDGQRLWASMRATGTYRSTDGGESWSRQDRGLTTDPQADTVDVADFRSVRSAVDADGEAVVYLAGFDGLFVSEDAGGRWRELQTLTEYIVGLDVSPDYAEDTTIAVMTYVKGAYISTDDGERWEMVDDGLIRPLSEGNKFAPVRRLHNVVFSPEFATDQTIYSATWDMVIRSDDGGHSWESTRVGEPPKGSSLRQYVLALSPAFGTDRTMFTGTRQGDFFRSDDAGADGSWELASRLPSRVRSIVPSPGFAEDGVVFVSTEDGVQRSDDRGDTWTATGPEEIAMLAISPDFVEDGTVFAGTEHGLFVTRDGGATWTESAETPLSTDSRVEALAVSPDFGADGTVLVSVGGVGLYRSTDGGSSFDEVGLGLTNGGHIIADFHNPTSQPIQFSPAYAGDSTVYAYAAQDVLRSTDGGDTWKVIELPSAAAFLEHVQHDPATRPVTDDSVIAAVGGRRKAALYAGGAGLLVLVAGGGVWFRRRSRRSAPGAPEAAA